MFIIPKRVVYNCFTHINWCATTMEVGIFSLFHITWCATIMKVGIFSLFHAEIIFQGPSWTTEAIWTVLKRQTGKVCRCTNTWHTCWILLIHFQYRNLYKISMLNHIDWSFCGTFMEFSRISIGFPKRLRQSAMCKKREVHSGCADEVWLVPCGPRPDKPKLKTPALDRYCMCQAVRWPWWSWGFP